MITCLNQLNDIRHGFISERKVVTYIFAFAGNERGSLDSFSSVSHTVLTDTSLKNLKSYGFASIFSALTTVQIKSNQSSPPTFPVSDFRQILLQNAQRIQNHWHELKPTLHLHVPTPFSPSERQKGNVCFRKDLSCLYIAPFACCIVERLKVAFVSKLTINNVIL